MLAFTLLEFYFVCSIIIILFFFVVEDLAADHGILTPHKLRIRNMGCI